MQDLVDTDVLEGWTVLIYNASMGEVVMLRSWVASLGGTAVRLTEVSDAEAFIARNAGSRIALVIEARSADLDERIEECLSLRARFPSCPIILLSETFGKNDFSTERMAVCDASLRSPVSQVAFKLAVPAALSNNAFFTSRRADRVVDPVESMSSHTAPAPVPAPAQVESRNATTRLASVWASAWGGRTTEVCLTCGVGLLFGVGLSLMF